MSVPRTSQNLEGTNMYFDFSEGIPDAVFVKFISICVCVKHLLITISRDIFGPRNTFYKSRPTGFLKNSTVTWLHDLGAFSGSRHSCFSVLSHRLVDASLLRSSAVSRIIYVHVDFYICKWIQLD